MRVLPKLFVVVLLMLSWQIQAQEGGKLSKDELNQWKREAKKYQKNPEALKALVDQVSNLRREKDQLQDRLSSVDTDRSELENQILQLQQENNRVNTQLASTQDALRQAEERSTMTPRNDTGMASTTPQGTVYRIQVGAFEKTRVPENLASSDDIKLENSDGLNKVLIGQFANFDDAKSFMSYLQRMGVKGAWIVPYRDGKRISLKEARGTTVEQ